MGYLEGILHQITETPNPMEPIALTPDNHTPLPRSLDPRHVRLPDKFENGRTEYLTRQIAQHLLTDKDHVRMADIYALLKFENSNRVQPHFNLIHRGIIDEYTSNPTLHAAATNTRLTEIFLFNVLQNQSNEYIPSVQMQKMSFDQLALVSPGLIESMQQITKWIPHNSKYRHEELMAQISGYLGHLAQAFHRDYGNNLEKTENSEFHSITVETRSQLKSKKIRGAFIDNESSTAYAVMEKYISKMNNDSNNDENLLTQWQILKDMYKWGVESLTYYQQNPGLINKLIPHKPVQGDFPSAAGLLDEIRSYGGRAPQNTSRKLDHGVSTGQPDYKKR